jgi:hypothetical protein
VFPLVLLFLPVVLLCLMMVALALAVAGVVTLCLVVTPGVRFVARDGQ